MATSLYRSFRELYRRRWYLAVIWVGLTEMAGLGPGRTHASAVPVARFDAPWPEPAEPTPREPGIRTGGDGRLPL